MVISRIELQYNLKTTLIGLVEDESVLNNLEIYINTAICDAMAHPYAKPYEKPSKIPGVNVKHYPISIDSSKITVINDNILFILYNFIARSIMEVYKIPFSDIMNALVKVTIKKN